MPITDLTPDQLAGLSASLGQTQSLPDPNAGLVPGAGTQQGLANALLGAQGPQLSSVPPSMSVGQPASAKPNPFSIAPVRGGGGSYSNVDLSGMPQIAKPSRSLGGNDINVDLSGMGKAAGGGGINFATPVGGPGTAGGSENTPFRVASTPTSILPGHDVQLGADRVVQGAHESTQAGLAAQQRLGEAEVGANEMQAQTAAGRAGQLQAAGEKSEALDKNVAEANAKAIAELYKNSDVDPNHWMSQQSVGKRMIVGLSAALMQGGMALTKQGGPNPVLEQIQQEIARDVDAQKSKFQQKLSAYHQFKEAGLNAQQALAATQKLYLDAGAKAIDATNISAVSPILAARSEVAKAQIQAHGVEADAKLYGHVGPQVVGGSGWTPAMAKESLEAWKADHEKGGTATIEQMQMQVAKAHNLKATGPEGIVPLKMGGIGGGGRSAGVQMEAQQNLDRLQQFRNQLTEAENMVNEGGKFDPARTAHAATLRHAMAAELGYVNAGKSPNETELATAEEMLPKDFNSFQFTGADKAKLASIRKLIDDKEAHLRASMRQVAQGAGFIPAAEAQEAAAETGATRE